MYSWYEPLQKIMVLKIMEPINLNYLIVVKFILQPHPLCIHQFWYKIHR